MRCRPQPRGYRTTATVRPVMVSRHQATASRILPDPTRFMWRCRRSTTTVRYATPPLHIIRWSMSTLIRSLTPKAVRRFTTATAPAAISFAMAARPLLTGGAAPSWSTRNAVPAMHTAQASTIAMHQAGIPCTSVGVMPARSATTPPPCKMAILRIWRLRRLNRARLQPLEEAVRPESAATRRGLAQALPATARIIGEVTHRSRLIAARETCFRKLVDYRKKVKLLGGPAGQIKFCSAGPFWAGRVVRSSLARLFSELRNEKIFSPAIVIPQKTACSKIFPSHMGIIHAIILSGGSRHKCFRKDCG